MDKINKFLLKLTQKERTFLFKIFDCICLLKLEKYDVKPLKGMKGVFRLRKGDIRVVFVKHKKRGVLIDMNRRKDIYKS